MELKDTINLMTSDDYKERFLAEYLQAKIRYDKLDAMTVKYEAGTLDFKPDCSLELLKEQKKHMGNYIRSLKIRAEIEGIDLTEGIRALTVHVIGFEVLREQERWHSVEEEGLPKESGHYLAVWEIDGVRYHGELWFYLYPHKSRNPHWEHVTHWMQWPELPEEGAKQ